MHANTGTTELPYERLEHFARAKGTPLLVVDTNVIRQRFEEFEKVIGQGRVFYALKANPHRHVVELMQELGAGFEISSERELQSILRRGVSSDKIISSNPIKTKTFLKAAYSAGVRLFAFDSFSEVEKLSTLAPGSRVYVRLSVSNEGSEWPLNKKFGVDVEEAASLLVQAAERGLTPYGVTFHVGSQCTEAMTWLKALEQSEAVWKLAKDQGIELHMLNLGGGFPIRYTGRVPSVTEIAELAIHTVNKMFPQDIEVIVEPGRALIGEAGILVSSVIAKATRNGQKWLYLDVGVFNGLMEILGGISYPVVSLKDGKVTKWVLAGPSCDSFDVVSTGVDLPELEVGDKVYIMSAGAYTTAYASGFNGCRIPQAYFV